MRKQSLTRDFVLVAPCRSRTALAKSSTVNSKADRPPVKKGAKVGFRRAPSFRSQTQRTADSLKPKYFPPSRRAFADWVTWRSPCRRPSAQALAAPQCTTFRAATIASLNVSIRRAISALITSIKAVNSSGSTQNSSMFRELSGARKFCTQS